VIVRGSGSRGPVRLESRWPFDAPGPTHRIAAQDELAPIVERDADRHLTEFVDRHGIQGEVDHRGAEDGVAKAEDPVPDRICARIDAELPACGRSVEGDRPGVVDQDAAKALEPGLGVDHAAQPA